jgi:hypothetical protein
MAGDEQRAAGLQRQRKSEPEECVCELPPRGEPVTPLQALRSTVLQSSLESLKDAGHFAAYRAALDPRWVGPVLSAVAGAWVEADAAMAHYKACDTLGLSADEQYQIGWAGGQKAKQTYLGTVVKLASGAGATNPWTLLGHIHRVWPRIYQGSGLHILRTGPKDVRIEVLGNPILYETRYYRSSWRGFAASLFELFTRKMYMHDVKSTPQVTVYQASWI